MTESLPRGNFGPGPASVPSISWFEFLLNETLLETHLNLENPDPSVYQLIIQFLQQADSHLAASTPDKPPATQIAVNGETVKEETNNQETKAPVKENRKVTALKLLALKVTAFLKWNLTKLMKSVPLVMIHSMLNDLCRRTMDCDLESICNSSIDFQSISPQAAFTIQLYHRFCILSVIKDSFPVRPVKSFVQMQGQVDPMIALAGANDLLVRNIRDRITTSVVNLEKCVECGKSIIMPSLQCIDLPKEDSDGLDIRWEDGITILPNEYNCQLYYDLGCFYFYQEAYSQAYVMFQRTKELLKELESPTYCSIDASRLNGYYTGCRSLQGVSDMSVVNMETMYEQAEAARKNNYQGLVELLIEDNLKQELSIMYRSDIEDEIANQGDRYNVLYIQVSICNVIRGVMEGKALVSLLANVLEDCDKETTDFLLMVLGKAFEGASNQQKSNLKCFIWHLIDLSSPGSKFPALVINGNLKDYFTEDELNEMELFTNDDNSNVSTYNDMYDDATTVCSSFPTSRDSSVVMGNTEYQLIHMYDTDVIRHLVAELCQNRNRPPSYVMSLNEKWRVPKEMHQILFNMQPSCDQAFVYILIGKACHCMDVRIYERARHMLGIADAVVADLSYTLSKHVRWYILLVDLQQYFLNEMLGESMSLQDLVKKTKTCITSVRLGQDIQPSHEVLEHCAAFLMNIRDWAYLSNLENTANGHIELCLLVSSLLKELSSVKNSRKVARDVWEAVVNIFSSAAHRRINTGRGSAFSRDPQLAVLSKEEFREFLKKLKEPTALSIFVSLLTKLYNILRDDISCEISSDYVALWPSALVNANTIHPSSIDEIVMMLMQHVLQVNPAHPSWLRTQADILFANGQYSPAMKYYMEAGVVASDFFSSAVPKSIYDEQVYRRMVKCCSYLQCYTQVAVLCQFLDETDYTTAFKSLQERNSYDAMDAYYNCIWDISMLEFLVHLHSKRGEMEKRQAAMRVLSQLDLNSNNPEDIVQRAVQMRKRKFLRSLAKQYL